MSCVYMSAWLRVCSSRALSRLRALFRVGVWCSDHVLTHVLSFGSCRGLDTRAPCFVLLCERVVSSSLDRVLSCPRVLWFARSLCFYRLRAFMSCLVLCGMQLVPFINKSPSLCNIESSPHPFIPNLDTCMYTINALHQMIINKLITFRISSLSNYNFLIIYSPPCHPRFLCISFFSRNSFFIFFKHSTNYLHIVYFNGLQTVEGQNDSFSAASKIYKRYQTMNKSLI